VPSKPKKLSNASPKELAGYLMHPDGWYRDMAQRLLVERNDRNIWPALTAMALKGKNNLGRFQALWTLQGLKLVQPDLLFQLVSDSIPWSGPLPYDCLSLLPERIRMLGQSWNRR
jgi:hypothetical protein